jgi:hypothetical protein
MHHSVPERDPVGRYHSHILRAVHPSPTHFVLATVRTTPDSPPLDGSLPSSRQCLLSAETPDATFYMLLIYRLYQRMSGLVPIAAPPPSAFHWKPLFPVQHGVVLCG